MNKVADLPHWEMGNIYPGLESERLAHDRQKLDELLADLEAYVAQQGISRSGRIPENPSEAATTVTGFLKKANDIGDLYETQETYLTCRVSTNSYDKRATKMQSQLESQKARLNEQMMRFRGWLGALAGQGTLLQEAVALDEIAGSHSFYLLEAAARSRYLMSEAEESLASQLMLSGAIAWARLRDVVVSQLKAPIEISGGIEETPLSIAATYLSEPDGDLRERSYRAIMQTLSGAGETLAACLNGVKGAVHIIDTRRNREDALHASLEQSRLDRRILDIMLEAMRNAFPLLRRYVSAKARLLGKECMPPWDIWAPVGSADKVYEWAEAQIFIMRNFAVYSSELEALAERAFTGGWIDAEPRDGKSGGGFCERVPSVQESRILINYDGRLGQLATLAHELGHAYHNYCLRGRSYLQSILPMTLAETASTFCETIITDAILAQANSIDDELAVLDSFLEMASALTLDIYGRYQFELEVFNRRAEAELSADELCELTTHFYRESYGESMSEDDLWPYLWAYLIHYYMPDLSFYNYPYTFGFLFSLGLYQRYQQGDPDFHEKYDQLLADSGSAKASDLAKRFGIDLYQPAFWASGYEIVRQRVDRFEELVSHKLQEMGPSSGVERPVSPD